MYVVPSETKNTANSQKSSDLSVPRPFFTIVKKFYRLEADIFHFLVDNNSILCFFQNFYIHTTQSGDIKESLKSVKWQFFSIYLALFVTAFRQTILFRLFYFFLLVENFSQTKLETTLTHYDYLFSRETKGKLLFFSFLKWLLSYVYSRYQMSEI
jgi:hypothetical protein